MMNINLHNKETQPVTSWWKYLEVVAFYDQV